MTSYLTQCFMVIYYQFGCGILKMVGSKMQDFCPRINMLKGILLKKNPMTNAGLSKIGHGFRK